MLISRVASLLADFFNWPRVDDAGVRFVWPGTEKVARNGEKLHLTSVWRGILCCCGEIGPGRTSLCKRSSCTQRWQRPRHPEQRQSEKPAGPFLKIRAGKWTFKSLQAANLAHVECVSDNEHIRVDAMRQGKGEDLEVPGDSHAKEEADEDHHLVSRLRSTLASCGAFAEGTTIGFLSSKSTYWFLYRLYAMKQNMMLLAIRRRRIGRKRKTNLSTPP